MSLIIWNMAEGKINAVLLKAIMSVMDMTIEQLLNEIGMS